MVEFFVRARQGLQFLDDAQLHGEVGLLLGFERGDVLVAAAAVLLEQLLEARLVAVGRRHELRLGTALLHECAALGLHRRATLLVEGDLQRLRLAAQRLHGQLLKLPREELHELRAALSGIEIGGTGGGRLVLRLLGRLLAQFESGVAGRQRGLLVGEIDPLVRGCGFGILRSGGAPVGRSARGRSGDRGDHICSTHIFGRNLRGSADLLLGSRKGRILSIHLTRIVLDCLYT